MTSVNNKLIAKNTLILYIRKLLTMFVSLYTSRVILSALGFVDYGVFNVVAGVIPLFSFINNAMSTASSRYMSFELGRKEENNLQSVFATSFTIHIGIAVTVLILSETVGWYVVNKVLNIPPDRSIASNVLFQFVIFTALLNIAQVPFNAMIISFEKMNIYAYIGVFEVVLKLCVAYLISISTYDKLILLGSLNLIVSIIIYIFYYVYCKSEFSVCKISLKFNKLIFKDMTMFSMWNLLGSSANMMKNQGINILINIFFGPVVNAANAIAYQINSAIVNLSNNFTTALNPQIIKTFASNEKRQMKNLIFRGSKFSFYLLMIISIPILLETDTLMMLWLKEVPQFSSHFSKLIICVALIESIVIPISVGVQATGRIKYYQIAISFVYLLSFPATYLSYKFGANPIASMIILIIVAIVNIPVRLFFLEKYTNIATFDFFKKVIIKSIAVFLISMIIPFIISSLYEEGFERLLLVFTSAIICSLTTIFAIGLDKQEKNLFNIKQIIRNKYFNK